MTFTGGTGLFITVESKPIEITAEFNNSYITPGFNITIHGLDGYHVLRLTSRDPEGSYPDQIVRGCDSIVITGDDFLVTDYEFQQFRSQKYILELYDDTITLQDTVEFTPPAGEAGRYFVEQGTYPNINTWLRSVSAPQLTRPCYIEDYNKVTRPGRPLSKDYVLGRRNAVVPTDVLAGNEGNFTFIVGVDYPPVGVSPKDIDFLIARGDILMLHTFDDKTLHTPPLYITVAAVEVERIGGGGHTFWDGNQFIDRNQVFFRYSVSYVEVDRPPTGTALVTTAQWQTIKSRFSSWQAVKDHYTDWLAVLANPEG